MMRRGWCPTVFAPMPSGDGMLVRVKPRGGRVSPEQARALADAALRDGNGTIELTSRGNLQCRGLSAVSAPRFAQAMIAVGLADADEAVERRRNIVVAPLGAATTIAVAAALESMLAADGTLAALPAKFGFAVAVPDVSADVRLHPVGSAWLVWPDGARMAALSDDPAGDALRLARAFPRADARRMRDVPAASVFAAAGLRPTVAVPEPAVPSVIGALPEGFGIGLPAGTTDAATLAALAGFGAMQLSPWRAVVITSPPSPPVREREEGSSWHARVAQLAAARDLIVDPGDPRLAVFACPGRPACASAQADVRADAALLAALFPGLALHVSGCAKGCAHCGPAAITLVAGADGYALVRGGTAGDKPLATGLTLDAAAGMIAA